MGEGCWEAFRAGVFRTSLQRAWNGATAEGSQISVQGHGNAEGERAAPQLEERRSVIVPDVSGTEREAKTPNVKACWCERVLV